MRPMVKPDYVNDNRSHSDRCYAVPGKKWGQLSRLAKSWHEYKV